MLRLTRGRGEVFIVSDYPFLDIIRELGMGNWELRIVECKYLPCLPCLLYLPCLPPLLPTPN
ncbi:MAG: hypothetical protein F6K47_42955 [Symploca sp. SIO2E6]|nr:hypothetical protein [Symploca sp. SIO2E6]